MDLPFETEDSGSERARPRTASIMVVDDEPVVREVCARLLAREKDLEVTLAEDAEEALERLGGRHYDVLITDKNLPGLGGVELIAEARRLQPTLEAVMITGYASSESIVAAFAAGASDYILKPFDDLGMLRAKVRAALERRAERVRTRDQARQMSQEAAELLAQGGQVPAEARTWLEAELRAYEQVSRSGPSGHVAVVGSPGAVEVLVREGMEAVSLPPLSPALAGADVVVLETGAPQWWEIAERLQSSYADVVLLASPQADLADLLDAITLRLDLVGFGTSMKELPERVRMVLLRRSLRRAQNGLALALTAFRTSLEDKKPF